MGRTKPVPQHMGEERRKQAAWNMLEDDSGQSSQQPDVPGHLTVVKDNDPSLLIEWNEAKEKKECTRAENFLSKTVENNDQLTPPHGKSCDDFVPKNMRTFFRDHKRRLALTDRSWSLCLPLYSAKHSRSQEVINNWHWEAGKFTVQLQDYDGLPITAEVTECLSNFEHCCLYIAHENEHNPIIYYEVYDEEIERESLASLEEEENRKTGAKLKKKETGTIENRLGFFWSVDLKFSDAWKFFKNFNRSGQKKFQLVCGNFSSTGTQFDITVFGRRDSLQCLTHPSEGFVLRDVNLFLFEVMQHFYNLGPMCGRESCAGRHQDFQELFKKVRALQLSQPVRVNVDVQHPCLKPLLRPYQRDAVVWMLQRERYGQKEAVEEEDDLHPLYTEVKTHCGKTLYYNRQGGSLVMDKPQKKISPPGGILADEMGLGKTVEFLCCLLLHPRPAIPVPSRLATLMEIKDEEEKSSVQATKKRRLSESAESEEVILKSEEVIEDEEDNDVQPRKKCKKSDARSAAGKRKSGKKKSTEVDKGTKAEDACKVQSKKKQKKGDVRRERKKRVPKAEQDTKPEKSCEKKRRKSWFGSFEYVVVEEGYDFYGPKMKLHRKPQFFICVCGKENSYEAVNTVQCIECGTSQHAKCMNYDLEDPFRGPYKCPHCHYNGKPLPSGATLIISPSSIAHQWIEEIRHHIHDQEKTLKVFEYTGSRFQGYVQPQFLARQDIVITTYETLRSELNYVDLKHINSEDGKCLRNPKRFLAQPTPLTAVEWWRICLDEAQMVERVTTKTAEMALRLSCINRWCVTGTPLNQSIKDLYGLLAFIGHDPYCVGEWWTKWLYEPYLQGIKEPMFKTLAKVMWRNSVKDVQDQLNLPDRSEMLKCLTFSPVEDVFYRRLYHNCMSDIAKSSVFPSEEEKLLELKKLDPDKAKKFLNPLAKLRQACCHPQAVSGSKLSMKNSNLTMEELLENLMKRSSQECVESHRGMIAAMNAQAGIYLIHDPPMVVEAVEKYREVLKSVADLEEQKQLKTDVLPVIHALHNLNQVLAAKPPGVGHTLRDDKLGAECEEMKKQYLQKSSTSVTNCQEQLAPVQNSIKELTKQLPSHLGWCETVLTHAENSEDTERLFQKLRETKASYYRTHNRLNFTSLASLGFIIGRAMNTVLDTRRRVQAGVGYLERSRFIRGVKDEVVRCCLRPLDPDNRTNLCRFCQVRDTLKQLETLLFPFETKRPGFDQEFKENEFECLLRNLLSYAKSLGIDKDVVKDGTTLMSLFDLWKKEFRHNGSLFTELYYEVAAEDELGMAVSRMRLRQLGEAPPGPTDINICEPTELQSLLHKCIADEEKAESMLKSRCGQLYYLRNLAKSKCGEFKNGINPELCPICQCIFGRNWSVMQCGHCFCMSCIQQLMKCTHAGRKLDINIRCSVCRERTKVSEISYVSTSRSNTSTYSVKGSHSSKVTAVVQCLMNIQKEDPEAKALVFATWSEVLRLIGQALEDNDIKFTHLFDRGATFDKNLSLFKSNKTVGILLLPYATGSKGLNLTEANHVLLVEPIYSPSTEAQAIGRVYRMGQTKPTKIHRFFVKRTIEERIHRLMEHTLRPQADTSAYKTEKGSITLGDLMSLFEEDNMSAFDNDDDEAGPSGLTDVTGASGGSGDDNNMSAFDNDDDEAGPSGLTDVTGVSSGCGDDDSMSAFDNDDDEAGPSGLTDVTGASGGSGDVMELDSSTVMGPDSVATETGSIAGVMPRLQQSDSI